ncbi:DUF4936 family protein [Glaciimonas sp. PCH181]|uniref:DUF4936 family protein n=1 Tax=Glaciimonas sp. PCH181 TaxID=2133943 RepID=UPI000D3C542E|nr:DUF4936 family protein [Glaciimonas sp. PCH181]PUA18493.1 DUF4936 domain-containing protein [Glaciimonas sp. PCH181]
MDLYIYYRVSADHAEQFSGAAVAMQASLSRQQHISSALKRRPEIENGHHTWMEVYENVPDDFTQTIAQAVADSGIGPLIEGQRHTELFLCESAFKAVSASDSEFSSTGSSCA